MIRRAWVSLVAATALTVVAAVVSAQTERKAATLDDLLAEIRGLRADLVRTNRTSTETQLLTARLALQEHRIAVLASQRANVSVRLAAAVRERSDVERRVKSLQDDVPAASAQEREERDVARKMDAILLPQRLEAERQVRLQETELTAMIEAEQDRWQVFNRRLDELEQSLSSGSPR